MSSVNVNLAFYTANTVRDYKYKDIKFSLEKDEVNRDFKELKDIEAVINSVKNIFAWRPGERILLPEFGNVLYQYLYEPINELNVMNIRAGIINMIEKWEPRVKITAASVIPNHDQNQYDVTLEYEVPTFQNYFGQFTLNLNLIQ